MGGPYGPRAQAEAVLAEVLGSAGSRALRAGQRGAETLARLAGSDPVASAEVSRGLLAGAERVVGECWPRGWQPADLVRVCARLQPVRTERPAEGRLIVDLVAAQHRRYAPETLDARWVAQLDELGARPWWGDDGCFLAGVVAREAGGGRAGAGSTGAGGVAPDRASRRVLEPVLHSWLSTVRRVAGLPAIAVLGPLPGERANAAPAPAAQGPRGPVDARQLRRVRALLAKAESTTFSEEADALTAKAQQLMARHSITAALLAGSDGGPGTIGGPAARRLGIDEPYEAPKALLLGAVAAANRCRSAWSQHFGFVTVVGFDADLDAVELLYTSLLVQATRAMTRAGGRADAAGASRTKSFRRSFLVAFASRIGQRLTEAARTAAEDVAAGRRGADPDVDGDSEAFPEAVSERDRARLLPVLAAREEEVEEATQRIFPRLVSHSVSVRDAEGWAHGTAAADQAVLSGRRGSIGA